MQTPGSPFLHERNPNLHASQEVEGVVGYLRVGGEAIPNEPANKISAYLGFLANRDYVNDGILTGNEASIDRQISAHVIRAKDVPEGYFELQRRIAREQGHGDIAITSEMRKEAARIISADQCQSLKPWVEYLSGGDAGYPEWFKLYAFDGVTATGKFSKEKEEFQKRSNLTVVPFPELSRGALSQVYTWVKESKVDGKSVVGVFEDSAKEAAFQKALKVGNFTKLYVHAIHKTQEGIITPEQKERIIGNWKEYAQDSNPRVLHGDLQGFGLDWCTATGFETATTHIKGGDFYVYYTRDEDGKDTVPRVAIRMQGGTVAEVRGINAAQELELEMADITSERLKDLPGGEEYIRKAEDMKRLTTIDKKIMVDPDYQLVGDELRFLYELDHNIQGFGYERDPRINEIREKRAGRDKPELARILPEAIRDQLKGAFVAYKTVEDQLKGGERRFWKKEVSISPQELERLFTLKDKEWRENGTYDFLVEELIAHGTRYNLVATPNIEASEKQIVSLAEAFGEQQPYSTYVYDELYREGKYSGRELSGKPGDAIARLSLIPSQCDEAMNNKVVTEQVRILQERQVNSPDLNFRVPSLLDAVTYWYTLRAQGDKLADGSAFDKTYIRHFDLEPKTVGGWSRVPRSYVVGVGRPYLADSDVEDDIVAVARLSVG